MTSSRVAVVTGGNRGIGLAICKGLARAGLRVILTSRREEAGREAAAALEKEGAKCGYFKLDVTREEDVLRLKDHLESQYGKLDVLVNNAGILIDGKEKSTLETPLDAIRKTFETNTLAPLRLAQVLGLLMKKNGYGRIVNMSSGLGQLADMEGGYAGYRLSKVSLNAVTRMLHSELQGTGILVNSACPGWVRTEMGGPDAPRTPEQGADTAVWLATLPEGGPSGGFFRDRKPIPW